MDDSGSQESWFQRLRAGDARAAEEVFARYARQLTAVAERHLSRKVAGREDGEDVVQSALRTFFRRATGGEFHIDGSGPLWRLLVKITLLKARARGRFHTADKRDVGAEAADPGAGWLAAASREPGPDEAAILADQIEVLLDGLPELYGLVLQLRLQGFGPSEIAAQAGVSRQTVHRALGLLQRRTADLG
jgi:RNA polymerase sigma-70 factor (ECF subfamily)